jgi:hypothetical protein
MSLQVSRPFRTKVIKNSKIPYEICSVRKILKYISSSKFVFEILKNFSSLFPPIFDEITSKEKTFYEKNVSMKIGLFQK